MTAFDPGVPPDNAPQVPGTGDQLGGDDISPPPLTPADPGPSVAPDVSPAKSAEAPVLVAQKNPDGSVTVRAVPAGSDDHTAATDPANPDVTVVGTGTPGQPVGDIVTVPGPVQVPPDTAQPGAPVEVQPAPAPAVGTPPTATTPAPPVEGSPLLPGAGRVVVALAATPPGEPPVYRYGIALGNEPVDTDPKTPDGLKVVWLPEDSRIGHVFESDAGVWVTQ